MQQEQPQSELKLKQSAHLTSYRFCLICHFQKNYKSTIFTYKNKKRHEEKYHKNVGVPIIREIRQKQGFQLYLSIHKLYQFDEVGFISNHDIEKYLGTKHPEQIFQLFMHLYKYRRNCIQQSNTNNDEINEQGNTAKQNQKDQNQIDQEQIVAVNIEKLDGQQYHVSEEEAKENHIIVLKINKEALEKLYEKQITINLNLK